MTISDYIQAIVTEAFPGAHYEYGRNTDFNLAGDNTPSPVVLCIEPDQGNFNLSSLSGNIFEGNNLFIRFLQQLNINPGEPATTREAAIVAQKLNAAQFITTLSNDDQFIDLNQNIPWIAVIEAYDSSWYGIEVQLRNLQFLQPEDVC